MTRLLLPLVLLFTGCTITGMSLFNDGFEYWDYDYDYQIEIVNIDEAHDFVYENVRYKLDKENEWQLPHESLESGYGDCEDTALMFADLVYRQLSIECYVVRIITLTGGCHVIAQLGTGEYYDPSTSYRKDWQMGEGYIVKDKYNYGKAMFIALVR